MAWEAPFDYDIGRGILDALIEINTNLADIRRDIGALRRMFEMTMGRKKKRKMTDDEIVEMYHPGATERHERVMRQLRELSDELKRRAEEQRRRAAETG